MLSPSRERLRLRAIALVKLELDKGTDLIEVGRLLVERNLMSPDSLAASMAVVAYWRSQQRKIEIGELQKPCSGDCFIKRNVRGVMRCAHSGLDSTELNCDELRKRSEDLVF